MSLHKPIEVHWEPLVKNLMINKLIRMLRRNRKICLFINLLPKVAELQDKKAKDL